MPDNVVMSLWVAYFDSWCEMEYFYTHACSIQVAIFNFLSFCEQRNITYSDHLVCRLEK